MNLVSDDTDIDGVAGAGGGGCSAAAAVVDSVMAWVMGCSFFRWRHNWHRGWRWRGVDN